MHLAQSYSIASTLDGKPHLETHVECVPRLRQWRRLQDRGKCGRFKPGITLSCVDRDSGLSRMGEESWEHPGAEAKSAVKRPSSISLIPVPETRTESVLETRTAEQFAMVPDLVLNVNRLVARLLGCLNAVLRRHSRERAVSANRIKRR